uniref:Acyltransferase n=1 Tax=Heterosigma akashiwo TaxID=2829 RepID=A0A6V1SPI9_HETAK|mmetsp:Transcript_23600/g.37317  ORF Transcript_23600/g.37317 Transcript_23600/m.37317 type:complete len:359 (-) Transcript_23600:457-1533(-)
MTFDTQSPRPPQAVAYTASASKQSKHSPQAGTARDLRADNRKPSIPAMPLHEHVFAAFTLGLLCGWAYVLIALYAWLSYKVLAHQDVVAGTVLATIISMGYWPADHTPWESFLRSWVFRVWRKYFDWEMKITVPLDPKRKYLFAEFPHGIFPMGSVLSASVVQEFFPGQKICGMGASVIYRGPVYRHFMSWIGTRPATKENFKAAYEGDWHTVVLPGGIAEIYLVSRAEERVYLRRRRGFVRVAVQNGADLVPMFLFGNSRILDLVPLGGGADADANRLSRACRRARCAAALFKGRFGLPIPYRQKIVLVSGKPIQVEQQDNPPQEYIDKLHAQFVASLEALYREHRPGWEDRPLVVT